MSKDSAYLDVIKQAQAGDEKSTSRLTEDASQKVFVYIYRVTLDHHLAEDLSQDTVLDMFKSLKRLKIDSENQFWAWLYRSAFGKVQHHFRCQGNKRLERKIINDGSDLLNIAPAQRQGAVQELLQKEHSQLVLKALGQLDAAYRNILSLRCFDQLSYAQIATVTGSTEVGARLQFFRAKQSLKKQLIRNGFDKEQLSSALILFGAITASSDKSFSAAAASPAALKAGVTSAIAGTAMYKAGIIAAAAAVIAASTTIGTVKVLNNQSVSVPSKYNNYKSLLDLEPPGLRPQVFAPGFISVEGRYDYGLCLSAGGQECYFVTGSADWSSYQIMETHYENGAWTRPQAASFSDNDSIGPWLADGDQSIYISRDKSIYKAVRTASSGWSQPVKQAEPMSVFNEYSCKFSSLGNLWLCSWRAGGSGTCDIWRLTKFGGKFIPENIKQVNSFSSDCNPVPGPQEAYFIFGSNRPGGQGGADLYISFADGQGGWTAPENMGWPINTSANEDYPYISPDGKFLFFVRESPNDSDIYWVNVKAFLR